MALVLYVIPKYCLKKKKTLLASFFTLRAFKGIGFYLAGACGRCGHVLGI